MQKSIKIKPMKNQYKTSWMIGSMQSLDLLNTRNSLLTFSCPPTGMVTLGAWSSPEASPHEPLTPHLISSSLHICSFTSQIPQAPDPLSSPNHQPAPGWTSLLITSPLLSQTLQLLRTTVLLLPLPSKTYRLANSTITSLVCSLHPGC